MEKKVRWLINNSDVLIEVVDARIPFKTRIKKLENYINRKNKFLLIVINKIDLIPKKFLTTIIRSFREENVDFVLFSAKFRFGIRNLKIYLKKYLRESNKEKIYVGVFGLVNVGKSSLINLLKGKRSARTSPQPGFTKGVQLLKISKRIYLYDSPGLYYPSENDVISRLYSPNPKGKDEICYFILENVLKVNPKNIKNLYKVDVEKVDIEELINTIGKNLGFFCRGGIVDRNRVYDRIIIDFHKGKLNFWMI